MHLYLHIVEHLFLMLNKGWKKDGTQGLYY